MFDHAGYLAMDANLDDQLPSFFIVVKKHGDNYDFMVSECLRVSFRELGCSHVWDINLLST